MSGISDFFSDSLNYTFFSCVAARNNDLNDIYIYIYIYKLPKHITCHLVSASGSIPSINVKFYFKLTTLRGILFAAASSSLV